MMRRRFLPLLLLMVPAVVAAQTVYLAATHPVYGFLDRMEAKQALTGYRDVVKPLSRTAIARYLVQIDTTGIPLTETDRELVLYYKEEFFPELTAIGYENLIEERWHLYHYQEAPGDFTVDLLGGYSYQHRAEGRISKIISNGINVYGTVGSSIGMYFNFRDNSENDLRQRAFYPYSSDPAQVVAISNYSRMNYDPTDVQFNVDLGPVTLSLEKMHNVWGAGERGNLILSTKSPSFPQIKMRAKFADNVDFTYIHGWLYSGIIDSSRTYTDPTVTEGFGMRRVFRPKYIASHILEMTPWQGVDLSIGESEVYGSRNPELLYLIPVMFFKAGEHWMDDTDNSQMFFSADLNVVKDQNYYMTLFLDEFSTETFTDPNRHHNQLGFTVGARLYDLYIGDTQLMVEYTRTNPWVYNHRFSDDTYQSHGVDLGHWIGQNADLFTVQYLYRPSRTLQAGLFFESFRKGGKDSTVFQYTMPPEVFLYGPLTKQQSFGIVGTWEPVRDLMVDFRILRKRFTSQLTATDFTIVNDPNEYEILPDYAGKWDLFVSFRYNFD